MEERETQSKVNDLQYRINILKRESTNSYAVKTVCDILQDLLDLVRQTIRE